MLSVLLLALTGCHPGILGGDSTGVAAPEPQPEPVEIVFWHTYSDEETRLFENVLLPRFHAEHPDIVILPERVMHTRELRTSLITRATSLKPPDVVRMDIAWTPYFSNHGLLYPLTGLPGLEEVVADLHPAALETNSWNGELFGLPLNINTKTAIYNRALLEQTGVDEPPASLEELFELAERHGLVIGMAGVDSWASLPYLYALGGSFMNGNYTRADGYLNSPETVEAVSRLLEWHRKGVLSPELFSAEFDRWGGIQEGHLLMIDEGPWFYSILLNDRTRTATVDEITLSAPFPSQASPASILGGENLVMLKGVRHPDAAWTFMRWMTDVPYQAAMATTGLLPTNQRAAEQIRDDVADYVQSYVSGMERVFLRPPVKDWERIEQVYTEAMQTIFLDDADVLETLDEAAAQIDRIMQRKNGKESP